MSTPGTDGREYLAQLAARARSSDRLASARASIRARGRWEEQDEWRISTVTTLRIEAVEHEGGEWFRVTVACDAEMRALCPTLERAVEFAGIFEALHRDLWRTVGWPTWAAGDTPRP